MKEVSGFKIDWRFAFRQNPICPGDWCLTIYHIPEKGYFVDIRSNFGFRSSGIFQQKEVRAVQYMMDRIKLKQPGKWSMKPFFDDEITICETKIAEELFKAAVILHELLGIQISFWLRLAVQLLRYKS